MYKFSILIFINRKSHLIEFDNKIIIILNKIILINII